MLKWESIGQSVGYRAKNKVAKIEGVVTYRIRPAAVGFFLEFAPFSKKRRSIVGNFTTVDAAMLAADNHNAPPGPA